MGNATDISASGISNLSVAVNNSSNTGGIAFGDNASVSISANGLPIISFGFNFSASSLNLSAISINNSTVGGKSFFSVSGIDSSALVGGKTIVIYGASSSYNAVCIKGQENVSFDQISASCTGENETIVACDGAPHAGMQCSLSGNALTVSGLNYSGVLQFQYTAPAAPPASSGSSGGGGGGGGGGGSVSSGMSGAWQMVDIGMNRSCNVTVTRRLSSAANLSVLTTIISNPEGNNCTMDDFLFLDSIPSGFAAISETNFTPPYASLDGRLAGFVFPSFAPGESKTIAYSVAKWAKPSELALFSNYSLSAKKQVPAVPLPEEGAAPGHERNESPPPSAEPGNYSLFPLVQPNANGSQAGRSAQSAGISIMAIAAMLLAMAAIVAMVAIYLMAMPKPAKKRKAVRPKVP